MAELIPDRYFLIWMDDGDLFIKDYAEEELRGILDRWPPEFPATFLESASGWSLSNDATSYVVIKGSVIVPETRWVLEP